MHIYYIKRHNESDMKQRLYEETFIEFVKILPKSKIIYPKDFDFEKEYYLSKAKEYQDPKRIKKT